MVKRVLSFFLTLSCLSLYAQSNVESSRITELYDLLDNKFNLHGKEVLIYDYKLKGKQRIKDSAMVSRISIVSHEKKAHTHQYDTSDYTVLEHEIINGRKRPIKELVHDESWRLVESRVVDQELNILSTTFYKYADDKLISEESFTGYAYLDEPRRLSLINYKYENGRLLEKNKKYSLNGTHWIQTWITKFDEHGNQIWMEEKNGNLITTYSNTYNSSGQLIKSKISGTNQKPSIKEITYDGRGFPKSLFWYYEKNKKPRRLTKYFKSET